MYAQIHYTRGVPIYQLIFNILVIGLQVPIIAHANIIII